MSRPEKYWKIFFVFGLLVIHAKTQIVCNRYWTYERHGNEVFGVVKIPNPNAINKVDLKIFLSINAKISPKYVGEIDLAKSKQLAISELERGLPIVYRVKFPQQNPLTKVTSIYLNNKVLCSSPKDKSATNFFLEYSFVIPVQTTKSAKSKPFPSKSIYANRKPFPTNSVLTRSGNFDVCGNPNHAVTITGLVIGGQSAGRGQFPWIAAYYHRTKNNLAFICGGSLISRRLIVTAAHCIQNKLDVARRQPQDAYFFVGKHNLESKSERDSVGSSVAQFIVHPDWNAKSIRFDADIALTVLNKPLQFSTYIKPICIWTGTTSYADLIGKNGVVVGWGKTEFTALTSATPQWTVVPVVDEGTCIRSHKNFADFTSGRTFCAGVKNGNSGPCTGDSGGGFVVYYGNRWFLRGIVSASLFDHRTLTCDVQNYAVFTDTARYVGWLQKYIKQYG